VAKKGGKPGVKMRGDMHHGKNMKKKSGKRLS
jgi:hypothetical protein